MRRMAAVSCSRESWKPLACCHTFKARGPRPGQLREAGRGRNRAVPGAVPEHVAAEGDSLVARITSAAKLTVSRITPTACHG